AIAELAELTGRFDTGVHLGGGFGPPPADVVHLPGDGELIPITALAQGVDGLLEILRQLGSDAVALVGIGWRFAAETLFAVAVDLPDLVVIVVVVPCGYCGVFTVGSL